MTTVERIHIVQGDITGLEVDAIVNAANQTLLGGGGVDGAVHRRAGPELVSACRAVAEVRPGVRCPTGQARLTPGFLLPARYVIHTVGPIWHGGQRGEDGLLAACYENSLRLAAEHAIESIAFAAISCGVYRFPLQRAARISIQAICDHLARAARPETVWLVAFETEVARAWSEALSARLSNG